MNSSFLQNPLNKEIVSMLAVSNLLPLEKELWLEVLPDMTDEEKEELRDNLKSELKYEANISEKAITQFVTSLEKGI
jgi:hypothetical protein